MDIQNKVVVVTGGVSGLGEATVRYLHDRGATVAAFDLNEERGQKLVADLGEARAMFIKVDVADDEAVHAAVEAVMGRFGAIHVCINCAGIPTPMRIVEKDGTAGSLGKFRSTIDVNLVGTFNVMSKCAAKMALNAPENGEERGVVINISSGAAFEGSIGQTAYSASKNGVIGLNIPAARELVRYGIRVNAIAPGLFKTPMMDLVDDSVVQSLIAQTEAPKRMGRMEEFAHCCAFMIENAYLNGETIRLDAATRLRAK